MQPHKPDTPSTPTMHDFNPDDARRQPWKYMTNRTSEFAPRHRARRTRAARRRCARAKPAHARARASRPPAARQRACGRACACKRMPRMARKRGQHVCARARHSGCRWSALPWAVCVDRPWPPDASPMCQPAAPEPTTTTSKAAWRFEMPNLELSVRLGVARRTAQAGRESRAAAKRHGC